MMNKLLTCLTISILVTTSQRLTLSASSILQFPSTTDQISLLISIDDQVTINVTGPINHDYFAIGFGNNQMLETYSIIFYPNGEINEYLLTSKTSQQPQKLLNTSINIEYFANSQNMIKATITRDIEGITNDHYSFNNFITNSYSLDIIYSMSLSQNISRFNTLNYHGIYKNKSRIFFKKEINQTQVSPYNFINDLLDDADNFNNFENYMNHTQFVTIGDTLTDNNNNSDYDGTFFNFLTKTQWIVLSGCILCFLIMSFVLLLFYRFYREWKIRLLYDTADDEISINGGSTEKKISEIDFCYHEKKKSILTQLDDEMLDEIHGAVMPQCIDIDQDDDGNYNNYGYNNINHQRPKHNRGKVGDFMRNVMPFDIPKDLIAIQDDDEEESYDDDEEGEFEEDEHELGDEEEEEEEDEVVEDEIEEEDDEGISDLSDSGSIRM